MCHRIQTSLIDCTSLREVKDTKQTKEGQRWEPPADDLLKINDDGGASQDNSNGVFGFIIRDKSGQAVAAGAGNIPYLLNPLHS